VNLDESNQLTVYRLVQESLTNIGKYAEARHAEIGVHARPGQVEVVVRDDGKGFDPDRARRSTHGLAGMRHRVEAAGGKLTVASSPGTGTRVVAVLPAHVQAGSAMPA
jgi:signal transduction histidine kinase